MWGTSGLAQCSRSTPIQPASRQAPGTRSFAPAAAARGVAGMTQRLHPHHQHQRLRLLVSSSAAGGQAASPGGTPSSGGSAATARQQLELTTTPCSSPLKGGESNRAAAVSSGLQQQELGGSGGGGGSNPNWLMVVLTAALGIVICYADRSNMSTAILPMAETYGWDKAFEGFILSAFFAGYAATQVLGGSLADRYGGKLVLTAGVALWSLFTVVTPAAAAAGTPQLLAARVLLGVGEGVAFPAIHSIIARNVPPANRSTAVGLVTAASYAGTALAFGLSPLLISRYGWQTVFYTFGGLAIVWLPLWLPQSVLGADGGPSSSGSSSSSSSRLKKDGKASPVDDGGSSSSDTEGQPLLPGAAAAGGSSGLAPAATGFAALMRRREVWAICATQYAQSYGMYGLLTWLPSFFSDYYGVAVADLGGYTLLPYFVQGCVGAGAGALADDLLSRRGWSVRSVRIALQLAGMLGPAGCLLAAVSPLAAGDPGAASALITLGLGLSALTLGAVSVNNFDIAPSHAGVVFGAGNTAATLAGLVSVPATGWVLQRTASWPLVFGLIAGHFVVGSAVWVAWMGDRPLPEDGPEPGVQAATAAQP